MKRILPILLFAVAIVLFSACGEKEPVSTNPDTNPADTADTSAHTFTPLYSSHSEWSYNLGIYEVNIRQYTEEGTFKALESHLPRLKEMGVGILWLMPIHPVGEVNRLGSKGSPYSVKDYLDVNPEYGAMEDFKHLVELIHEQGMFVIIDWVANHTSWDNVLTQTNPEFYNTDGEGNFIPPPGTNWTDVIDLDYTNSSLKSYMLSAMEFWVTELGIDGFRFDAVDYISAAFWEEAITYLKNINPGIFMLAEGDRPNYHNIGFDATYAWALHGFDNGIMRRIYEGTQTANDLDSYIAEDLSRFSGDAYRMTFTSNHDENSWHGTVFEQFGESAELFAVLTHTAYGFPLIYSGQEAGLNRRLAFFDRDVITWTDHPFKELYTALLELKKENQALWNGDFGGPPERIETSNNEDIYAFIREKEGDRVVGIFNISGTTGSFTLSGDSYAGEYTDVFTGEAINLTDNMEVSLDAWDYRIVQMNVE